MHYGNRQYDFPHIVNNYEKTPLMRNYASLVAICYSLSILPILANTDTPVVNYIEQYKAIAISEMERTGIPASITLAQAVVESKYGTSTLAVQSNNHFGIKCKGSWEGRSVYYKDDDYQNGKLINSCFRGYDDPVQSYYDHSDFLLGNKRYQPLFQLYKTDYKGWAKGLKKCGYATDPKYATALIETIEKYQLYIYDQTIAVIQPAYSLSIPVKKEEIGTNRLVPPKAVKLPHNYRIGQGTDSTTKSLSFSEAVYKGQNPYLFELVPTVRREEVE